jgi:hypothetical protein
MIGNNEGEFDAIVSIRPMMGIFQGALLFLPAL